MVRHYAHMCVHRPTWKFSTKTEKKIAQFKIPILNTLKKEEHRKKGDEICFQWGSEHGKDMFVFSQCSLSTRT